MCHSSEVQVIGRAQTTPVLTLPLSLLPVSIITPTRTSLGGRDIGGLDGPGLQQVTSHKPFQNTTDPAELGAEQQCGCRCLGKEMPQPLLEPVLQLVLGETELWCARLGGFISQGTHSACRKSHREPGMQGAHVYSLHRVFLGLGKCAGEDGLCTFPV